MRPLVLCQACKRHVKGSDVQCPFCSTAVVDSLTGGLARSHAPSSRAAARGRGLPGGRAALFLAGSVLAQGCAEEFEPDAPDGQNDGGDAGDGAVAKDGGQDAGLMASPVYGVAIDSGVMGIPPYGIAIPPDAGAADSAVSDASCPRFGNLPVPVYGIPVDSGTRKDMCTDAGADAGKDAGLIAVPPYGIPFD